MGLKHVYWITLIKMIIRLCKYYDKWKAKLPADLPDDVKALLLILDAACLAAIIYDRNRPRGTIAAPTPE